MWHSFDTIAGMDTGTAARPDVTEIREHHLTRLNDAVRRPAVWGGETTIRVFLDSVAFVDGRTGDWAAAVSALRARGAFLPTGVRGAVARVLGGYGDDSAMASVYADVAWRLGWLTADRTITGPELRHLHEYAAQDRSLEQVLAELGDPSVWIGPRSPAHPKTLAWASDRVSGLTCLHFWPAGLVAMRHGTGTFADTFTFTPRGAANRSCG
jgi:hypothetical protein